jgi:GNAT superfamily N-acetyltransferase
VVWVEELMVGESSRHQGVASKLMSAAEEWARTIPTAYIALASRRADDFYLRIGYEGSATCTIPAEAPERSVSYT